MLDFDELRAKLPQTFFFDHQVCSIRVDNSVHEVSILRLDDLGRPEGIMPADAVSFRWQYSTRMTNLAGEEMWTVRQSPSFDTSPFYIGTIHDLGDIMGLPLTDEAKKYLYGYPSGHYIVAPCGFVLPYDNGDKVVDPREFGLRPALPSEAA